MTRESPFRQAEPVEAWFLTLDCRLRGNDGERMTRESPFRQAEPVEAWFLTLDCRLRGNDGNREGASPRNGLPETVTLSLSKGDGSDRPPKVFPGHPAPHPDPEPPSPPSLSQSWERAPEAPRAVVWSALPLESGEGPGVGALPSVSHKKKPRQELSLLQLRCNR